MIKKILLPVIYLFILQSGFAQPAVNKAIARKIDSLFATYNNKTPGAAVAVVKDGKVIFKKGYGMANLEHNIPVTTQTVFDIASVSKQFTAFAVCLLESEGRLSLEDPIKKYIPEIPDYAKAIKIRHLISHTSGLKDHGALVSMAGYLTTDLMHTSQLLKMMNRQKSLEFEPGTAYKYCNSSYVLLTEIVHRITGKTFSRFTTDKIFTPLGMSSTRFADNHQLVIRNRAHSYEKQDGEYFYIPSLSATPGPSGLLTTADDLIKWVLNFENPVVGTREMLNSFNEISRLDNGGKVFVRMDEGDSIFYAKGQFVTRYNETWRIGHGGHTAGFRTFLGRFPEHRIAVIQLSNDEHNEGLGGRYDIAAFYIPQLQAKKKETVSTSAPAQAVKTVPVFTKGIDLLAGKFYCPELETTYQLVVKNGTLVMSHSRLDDITLNRVGELKFTGSGPNTFAFEINFIQNGNSGITGFAMSNWGARNMIFQKINE